MISGLLQRDYEQLTRFCRLHSAARQWTGWWRKRGLFAREPDRHSAMLGLEWGIESLSFFDADGGMRDSMGAQPKIENHRQLALQALTSDAPVGRMDCLDDCVLTPPPQLEGTREVVSW